MSTTTLNAKQQAVKATKLTNEKLGMMNKQKTFNFKKIHAEEPSFETKSKMKEKEEKVKKKNGIPK